MAMDSRKKNDEDKRIRCGSVICMTYICKALGNDSKRVSFCVDM